MFGKNKQYLDIFFQFFSENSEPFYCVLSTYSAKTKEELRIKIDNNQTLCHNLTFMQVDRWFKQIQKWESSIANRNLEKSIETWKLLIFFKMHGKIEEFLENNWRTKLFVQS